MADGGQHEGDLVRLLRPGSDDGGVTSSQGTGYVFPAPVAPVRGKGALERGGFTASAIVGHRADDMSWLGWNETMGKLGWLGRMRISA